MNYYIDITEHHPHIKTLFHRWWWRWVCPLPVRHLRWCVWLRWGSCAFFGPGRGPGVPSAFWWWLFTPGHFVIPTPEHLSTPRRFDRSPGLWTARVSSSRRRPGHLEPQGGKRRGALWTIWRRAQAFSPRPHSRLGGRNLSNEEEFVCIFLTWSKIVALQSQYLHAHRWLTSH